MALWAGPAHHRSVWLDWVHAVSERDGEKWNARYRDGAYAGRRHPSGMVTRWAERVRAAQLSRAGGTELRALDIACGAGRNALWLAEAGFRVDAVDIADAGLERARAEADARGLHVGWRCLDLDDGLPPELEGYDLIIVVRFLARELLPVLPARLRPGGHLLCEIHLQTDAPVVGPTGAAFRVAPGELVRLLPGLEVLELDEGRFDDPDGQQVALARCVGMRPY